ncbi:sn-glycerol-1-phosphate dehydrogenase [Aquibacillus sediminis]|uniref:sn-glycerol-1-phosphate dehydrogenase n=1 Tax=Aquibacillus sediminis TaxID=2574734 RepID=UPI001109CA4D|nr:sn-glycerol-1-phosphate dehydrogenase [Aquibacillus sediminis]
MMTKEISKLLKQHQLLQMSLAKIVVKKDVLENIADYINYRQFNNVTIVCDKNTNLILGEGMNSSLTTKVEKVSKLLLHPNKHNQVLADEQAIVQLLVEVPSDTDVLIAVGSGTIHDIVRFAAHKMKIPFISVPTAASVDGFTSKGAPLILRGFKQTIQTTAPIAVFADIDIIKEAPKEMTAAGFGDILGKYTSLLDWKISECIGNEPYNQLAASITRNALDTCVEHVDLIASGDDKGMQVLMEALIDSGLVMLILNHSKPASGGEHHLSHYWEMELLKQDKVQLLHGAKVGVATAILSDRYKEWKQQLQNNQVAVHSKFQQEWSRYGDEIKELIDELPSSQQIRKLLATVGGPTTTEELGIPNSLLEESLHEAHHLRPRCTGLFLMNQV